MRVAIVVLLALAAIWAVLGSLDLVPLPFGLGSRDAATSAAGSTRGAGADAGAAEDDASTASLQGRGRAKASGAEMRDAAAPLEPAEVRGTFPHGAVLRGRVVTAGRPARPVIGASVRLLRAHAVTTFLKTPAEGRWDELTARSGEDGQFAFLDVRPARGYVVRARFAAGPHASSDRFEVVARQVKDLGELVLGAAGTLRGGGTEGSAGTLEGRVTDGAGKPVAGAQVAVGWQVETFLGLVMPDPELLPEIEVRTETDTAGRYRLTPLEYGNKTLVVASPMNGGSVATVKVGEGTTVHDVKLAADGVIAGRVEWEDGKPAADVRVFAVQARRESGMVHSARSGPDGSFRIDHISGNDLRLSAFVPGIPVRPTGPIVPGTLDVVLRLPLTGALTGRVVRKVDGKPVPQFGILLEPQGEENVTARALRRLMSTAAGAQGFVSADGTFRLPELAEGTYVVVVQAAGFPDARSLPATVPAGQTGDAGTIALVEGNGVTGWVRTVEGEPVASASVYLVADRGATVDGEDVEIEVDDGAGPDATTDEEGRFALGPQTPGVYRIYVSQRFIEPRAVKGIDLKEGPLLDLDLRMHSAGTVRVTLTEPDGTPASQENVLLIQANGWGRWGQCDEEGREVFESVPMGACLVYSRVAEPSLLAAFREAQDETARSRAWDALRTELPEVIVQAGQEAQVAGKVPGRVRTTLRIKPWSSDVKQVVDAWLRSRKDGDWYRAPRQADGTFLGRVPAGSYDVYAVPSPGGWDAHERFALEIPDEPAHTAEVAR